MFEELIDLDAFQEEHDQEIIDMVRNLLEWLDEQNLSAEQKIDCIKRVLNDNYVENQRRQLDNSSGCLLA